MKLGIAALLLSVAVFAQQPPEGPKPEGAKRPPEPPKNLKILQPGDVRATMGAFRTALGVQCSYCHVQSNFASDENHKKEVARHMMNLVKDINAKFPDGKQHVTCFTCHRGATEPLTAPPQQ